MLLITYFKADDRDKKGNRFDIALIAVGAASGIVAIILVISIVIVFVHLCKRKSKEKPHHQGRQRYSASEGMELAYMDVGQLTQK